MEDTYHYLFLLRLHRKRFSPPSKLQENETKSFPKNSKWRKNQNARFEQ
jgi:hypothetical protein